jgi:hypothetical protein
VKRTSPDRSAVSFGTTQPQPVAPRQRPACPLCGAELRFSHREYAGRGASVAVLRCAACGATARGGEHADRDRSMPPRRRPLPDAGQPDNYVLDSATADRLLRSLDQEAAAPGDG